VHPEAFSIGGFSIYWYGIFAAIGFFSAFTVGSKRAVREGLKGDVIMGLAPWIIFGAIIGARLLYVINYWDEEFAGRPLHRIITIGRSGLVFYGGLIGASLGTILYCWKNKLPLWKIGDIMSPSIALGHAFGRIGCLMTGCCYGRACDLPWAIHFPSGGIAPSGVGLHPTQIYESILNFLFFGFLTWLYRRKKFDGQIFSIYLIGYAILRGTVEYFRGDYKPEQYVGGVISPGQGVSIAMFAIGITLWFWLSSRPRGAGPTPSRAQTQNG
jgi:phosphatidylglycerol---prolipoprotein diacylglyceryl transferase